MPDKHISSSVELVEASIYRHFTHSFMNRAHAILLDPDTERLMTIQPLADGDVSRLQCMNRALAERTHMTWVLVWQIAHVLSMLHAHRIVVRDICPGNILVQFRDALGKWPRFFLSDFGLACFMRTPVCGQTANKDTTTSDFPFPESDGQRVKISAVGSIYYTAPENFIMIRTWLDLENRDTKRKASKPVSDLAHLDVYDLRTTSHPCAIDVYALGAVAISILTQLTPSEPDLQRLSTRKTDESNFESKSDLQDWHTIFREWEKHQQVEVHEQSERDHMVYTFLRQVLLDMVHPSAQKRPSALQVMTRLGQVYKEQFKFMNKLDPASCERFLDLGEEYDSCPCHASAISLSLPFDGAVPRASYSCPDLIPYKTESTHSTSLLPDSNPVELKAETHEKPRIFLNRGQAISYREWRKSQLDTTIQICRHKTTPVTWALAWWLLDRIHLSFFSSTWFDDIRILWTMFTVSSLLIHDLLFQPSVSAKVWRTALNELLQSQEPPLAKMTKIDLGQWQKTVWVACRFQVLTVYPFKAKFEDWTWTTARQYVEGHVRVPLPFEEPRRPRVSQSCVLGKRRRSKPS